MNVLSWMLFGLLVGLIVNMVRSEMTGREQLISILLAVSGAILGGVFAAVILDVGFGRFHIISFVNAAIGALLFLFTWKRFREL